MANDDEEKIGFYMEEGVYCFTHMPKELKNSTATLQMMMEKVLANQRGQNVEIHLKDIVIKSRIEQNLIQDVKETLRKLRRVNIKIDPTMSSFGVKEGKFLGHMGLSTSFHCYNSLVSGEFDHRVNGGTHRSEASHFGPSYYDVVLEPVYESLQAFILPHFDSVNFSQAEEGDEVFCVYKTGSVGRLGCRVLRMAPNVELLQNSGGDSRPDLSFYKSASLERLFCSVRLCDAGWQKDKDDSRSQSGWVLLLNGGAMTRKSSKQDTVAKFTCESEYIAACVALKEAIWIKNFIRDLGVVLTVQDPIEILCDNESAVALTKEPKDHGKSNHIEREYHFVRSKVKEGNVIVKDIRS
nr:putative retrotransposon protein [Tanacetum cinerariifolium]